MKKVVGIKPWNKGRVAEVLSNLGEGNIWIKDERGVLTVWLSGEYKEVK